ncbi:MAG: helix-turn-helix transcriptional regulator [Nitrospirae bacterium]|nr:helix-turn-helix transcriptional regulator [Nitrospirota bacterium]
MNIYNFLQPDDDKEQRNMMNKSFGRKIRDIRLMKNLTQEKVAETAGINPKYLGEIERGLKGPTALVVYKLSKALEVPICEVLSTDGCPHINGKLMEDIARLFNGRKETERKKAIKILEVFFE